MRFYAQCSKARRSSRTCGNRTRIRLIQMAPLLRPVPLSARVLPAFTLAELAFARSNSAVAARLALVEGVCAKTRTSQAMPRSLPRRGRGGVPCTDISRDLPSGSLTSADPSPHSASRSSPKSPFPASPLETAEPALVRPARQNPLLRGLSAETSRDSRALC